MAIKLTNKGGEDFAPIPSGVHQAVCYGVVDVGTHKSKNPQHAPKRKLVLLFELPFERADFGEGRKNQPRGSSVTLTQSLSENAILRKMFKSWRGRDFTAEELKGFDPKALIGVNCQLNIIHDVKGDKTYANIDNIMPLSKGMNKCPQENPTLYYSLDDEKDYANLHIPQNMPKWIEAKVRFSEEVVAVTGDNGDQGGSAPASNPEAEARHNEEVRNYANTGAKPAGSIAARPAAVQENLDEDVPF